jgi:ABC-type nitrate/sulfonate/bicarbonate transport system substrate-binding protein
MKRSIFVFAVLVMVLGLFSCNQKTNKHSKSNDGFYQGTIKVGHLVALDMAPLFLAKEAGYFKEEGLNVETVFFSNPGDNNTALAGGSLQFTINPFTLPYFAANSGIKMRIISNAGGLGIMEVVVQGELNIEDIDQLVTWIKAHPKTKLKIAVLKGDTLEMIIQKLLADNSLTYEDVEMVWFNDLLAMVQSFQTKQVDILSHIKPYTTEMIVKHGAKSLATNSTVWGEGTPNCTQNVMEGFMNKYPGTCKAYLKAIEKGWQLMIDDPEKAADILFKGNYYKVDKDVLLYAINNQPKKIDMIPNYQGMMLAINAMVKEGYIQQPKENIINLSFIEEVNSKTQKDEQLD